jgi:cell division septation protein DedD
MLQGGPPIELRPGLGDDDEGSDPDNGMPNSVADEVAELADLSKPDRGIDTAALEPIPAPRAPAPAPRDVTPQFAFSESGQFLVQMAAFRSQDAAETEWRKSAAEHPQLFRGAGKRIQRADLGAKGVFYRLRVGGFAEKSEATAFCDALKATGDNCIVVTG